MLPEILCGFFAICRLSGVEESYRARLAAPPITLAIHEIAKGRVFCVVGGAVRYGFICF
jgi:hypothetical protein